MESLENRVLLDRPCTVFWESPDELIDCTISKISGKMATLHFENSNIPKGLFHINISFESFNFTLRAELLRPELDEGWSGPQIARFVYKSWWEKKKVNAFIKLVKKKIPQTM